MKIIILSLFLFLFLSVGHSQDCTDFHQYHCLYEDYTFFYSRQSKSIQFRKGQSSEIQIIAYGGEEYYLAVCGNEKLDNIRFRIIEDNSEKTILYDNATNKYLNSIHFINEVTRKLIIQLSVPEGSARESKHVGCVGVVIQLRRISQGA